MPTVEDDDSAVSIGVGESSKTTERISPRLEILDPPHLTAEEQAAQDLENAQAAHQAETSILVDSDRSSPPSDAGYETDSIISASTSMATSVRDFAFENGRRYHKFREGRYNFPNDDSEQDREDMKHAMVGNLCQALHFAPIGPSPHEILDMGTGTGIWAIEGTRGPRYLPPLTLIIPSLCISPG
jgi:hypothetical protein